MLRKRLIFSGIVQGVGMRPFLFKAAASCALTGFAKNTREAVVCEVQGIPANINKFLKLIKKTPAQIKIEDIKISPAAPQKEKEFRILESEVSGAHAPLLPPDLGLCKDCAKEISDPQNRRYNYALTNCSYCGPRYSIAQRLPYDRKNTTMSKFKMCPQCQAEYDDPASRRFHAEPNSCPACSPQIKCAMGTVPHARATRENRQNIALYGVQQGLSPVHGFEWGGVARALKGGKVVAIKTIGGFHLACDALNERAVLRLRRQKNRPDKPFTIMFGSLKEAQEYCHINATEKEFLTSDIAPIVLLKKKKDIPFISEGLNTFGVMLAYSALHKVLFNFYNSGPLVMTSANESNEAIIADEKLVKADLIVSHDRDIYNRIDDSIVFESSGEMHVVRRARGFVNSKIKIDNPKNKTLLAYGAQKTGGFCLVKGNYAYLSQYLGDLKEKENQIFYLETLEKTKKFLNIKPKFFARDMHPQYFTSRLAAPKARPVPHHAAHALAVGAQHRLKTPYLGIIYDGLGLGPDGALWGGEFLEVNAKTVKRRAHFLSVPLLQPDTQDIWKFALSYLPNAKLTVPPQAIKSALNALRNKVNVYPSSSVGRIFDAAACLAGLRNTTTYQAQAAMELESLCKSLNVKPYSFEIKKESAAYILNTAAMLKEISLRKESKERIAARFHKTLITMTLQAAKKIGIKQIVLSGGCFQNKVLLCGLKKELEKNKFKVYTGNIIPAGDGGVALGQAIYKIKELSS